MGLGDFGFGVPKKEASGDVLPEVGKKITCKPIVVESRDEESQDYWNEMNSWIKKCEEEGESYVYRNFDYYAEVSPDSSKVEYVQDTETFERLWKGTSESYGGSWGGGGTYRNKEDLIKLRKDLLEWKRNWLLMPYCKEKADDYIYRGVKKENIKVFFSSKAKEMIERVGGWSVDGFIKEFNSIKEAELMPEYEEKADRFTWVGKRIDTLFGLISKREHALKQMIEDTNVSNQMTLSQELDGPSKIIKLFKELQDWKIEITRLEKQKGRLREELIKPFFLLSLS